MIATQGSLTMVGLNTQTPKIFWNGKELTGILSVRVDCDEDEQRIKIRVSAASDVSAEMQAGGVNIKVSV